MVIYMSVIYVKQNDTKPDVKAIILDDDDEVISLSGATAKFFMKNSGGTLKVDGTATITDAAAGAVKYEWATGDLDTVGTYTAEFQITFSDTTILTAPSKGYMTIVVSAELN